MITLDQLVERLRGRNPELRARRTANGFEVTCPCHQDIDASLCLGEGKDGRPLVRCQAGCQTPDIVATIGLRMADLMPHRKGNGKPQIVATYDYTDESGELLYQVVRYSPKDFRQRRPDGKGGWTWSLGDCRRVLYRLPELLAADPNEPVVFSEGEKDANNCWDRGLVATTNPGGADKWRPEYADPLKGRPVVLIADNDAAGKSHVQRIRRDLLAKGCQAIVVIHLPDLPPKGDISDWFAAGHTADELRELITIVRQPFANAIYVGHGRERRLEPLGMSQILTSLRCRTDDWPRNVDHALFVDGREIDWLNSPSALFGWVASQFETRWHRSAVGCATKDEFFAELRRTSQRYVAVEQLPHHPPIQGHYYACGAGRKGNGKTLEELLEFFSPATPIDRDLLQAAMMTVFWGGPAGSRPAFVITSDFGRGAGKSAAAKIVGQLAGGLVDFAKAEEIPAIKTRLLSQDALTKRVALLDNIKSLRFSWAEMEGLITANVISGHRMYHGEAQRPNVLTWLLTLNGASLSTDMAQRSVIIKLNRPKRSATWEECIGRFVRDNHDALVADVIAALQGPQFLLAEFTRWATWERDILQRLPEPAECQRVILERQAEADAESDEATIIAECFADQLAALNYADSDVVLIPSRVAAEWLGKVTNDRRSTSAASRILKQLIDEARLPGYRANTCKSWPRGIIREGVGETKLDLDVRINRRDS